MIESEGAPFTQRYSCGGAWTLRKVFISGCEQAVTNDSPDSLHTEELLLQEETQWNKK